MSFKDEIKRAEKEWREKRAAGSTFPQYDAPQLFADAFEAGYVEGFKRILLKDAAICDEKMLELLVVAAYKHDEISIGRAVELLPHRSRDWILERAQGGAVDDTEGK